VIFLNRSDAGKRLAKALHSYRGKSDVIVLALPRGGVPVAFEVACELGVPLDVFVVRKLGAPWQKELAMGAIASGGVVVLNKDVIESLEIAESELERVAGEESVELRRRELAFRGDLPAPVVANRLVILVDDGLATGATMRAAIMAVKAMKPKKLVVAVPVAARQTCDRIAAEVDQIVCVQTPVAFEGVGQWYADFEQTSDEEVRNLLAIASSLRQPGAEPIRADK